jgi:hypothetical protein
MELHPIAMLNGVGALLNNTYIADAYLLGFRHDLPLSPARFMQQAQFGAIP